MKLFTVSVIGLGYIGLPMATLLAKVGHKVQGIDINASVVQSLNDGAVHLEEPGLQQAFADSKHNFKAFTEYQPADVHVIAVPTPFVHESKKPDMRFVRAAATALAAVVKEGDLVVLESTSPVGATQTDVADVIFEKRPDLKNKIDFAFAPERAIPGKTLQEMVVNDRVVGGLTPEATTRAVAFYGTFVKGKLLATSAPVAELVKLAENTYRDVNIALANELGHVCHKLNLNVWDVIKFANHHPRVNIHQPGPGVGGHCIAVDPWFVVDSAPELTPLIQTARKVNDEKPHWVLNQIEQAISHTPNPVVALLGLAYKPDVDDFRESPSLFIATQVMAEYAKKAQVLVCDPFYTQPDIAITPLAEALEKSNIVVLLTDHAAYKQITPLQLKNKKIIDTRGTWANSTI